MLHSMTSFARTEHPYPWGNLVWEIRTVNHRYLDMHFKLADCARAFELPIREKLKRHLTRGKVECFLRVEINEAQHNALQINQTYLQALLDANTGIASQLKNTAPEKASTFLQWPGVIESVQTIPEDIETLILASFDQALSQLISHRQREGETLAIFIQERLVSIQKIVDDTREHLPTIVDQQQQKLREKINQIKVNIDQERLEQELVFIAQKADVAEEIDRLEAHLKEIKTVIKKGSPCGRRLDFLMQELNREANTLGSKSINIGTSQASIDLKVFIEQMREQIQNIE